MKKPLLIIIFCTIYFISFSQSDTTSDKIVRDATINALDNKKANDKENWSAFIYGFANIVSDGGNSLSFNPTIWELINIDKNPNNQNYNYKEYNKSILYRNFQINSSVSPDNHNQFSIDSASFGFKYAIINNRAAKLKDYQTANSILSLGDSVFSFLLNTLGDVERSRYIKSGYDEKYIDPRLLSALKSRFNIKGKVSDALDVKKFITNKLARKPLWTFSFSDNYDFRKSRTNSLLLSSEFTFVPFTIHDSLVTFDLTMSYNWQADTTVTSANFDRHILEIDFGKNFSIWKWFELKPTFSYVNTKGTLYKKEVRDAFNASLTLRFKINDQFWFPLTFKYEPANGQILGFISVQYSLK